MKRSQDGRCAKFFAYSIDLLCIAGFDGYLKEINPAWEKTFGHARAELLGRPYLEFVHPDDREASLAAAQKFSQGAAELSYKERWLCRDGSSRWIRWHATASPAERMIYAVGRDITEYQRMNEEVRDVSRRSAAILESISDGFNFLDREWRYAYVNPAGARMVGKTPEELLGRILWEVWPKAADSPFGAAYRRAVAENAPVTVEAFYPEPLERWFEVRCYPSPEGLSLFFSDVTARKAAEAERVRLLEVERAARAEAEEANRSRDRFLALVSHELRTPLTAVLGWLWLLRSGELGSGQREYGLKVIERNMQLEKQIVNDLLDVSGLIRRQLTLKKRPLDLGGLVAEVASELQAAAVGSNLRLECAAAPGSWVEGDPMRLRQVFANLISNAIKFTPPGGKVSVLMRRVDGQSMVTVADTGPGFSREFYPHLFDLFRQNEDALTREHRGLGLGLAIVKRVVELHGGSVAVDPPAAETGARLTVSLPLVAPPTEAPAAPAPMAARGAPAGSEMPQLLRGVRILVVEDDDDTRHMLTAVLAYCGAEARSAASALEGFSAFNHERPDVLISDIAMAGEDGYSLIRRIRALRPQDGGQVPAAAVTAYATAEDRAKALNAGYQIYLPKPVDPAELLTVVRVLARKPKAEI